MSDNNLTSKEFFIENPIEIDAAVEELRVGLADAIEFIDRPYHIAQRFFKRVGDKAYYFPQTYISTNAKKPKEERYLQLTPNSGVKCVMFFLVGDEKILEQAPLQSGILQYPVSIVFSANLEKIAEELLPKYRFTQLLVSAIRTKLINMAPSVGFSYTVDSVSTDLKRVFREFVLDDIEQYNRAPMQCFRFELTVIVESNCLPPA